VILGEKGMGVEASRKTEASPVRAVRDLMTELMMRGLGDVPEGKAMVLLTQLRQVDRYLKNLMVRHKGRPPFGITSEGLEHWHRTVEERWAKVLMPPSSTPRPKRVSSALHEEVGDDDGGGGLGGGGGGGSSSRGRSPCTEG